MTINNCQKCAELAEHIHELDNDRVFAVEQLERAAQLHLKNLKRIAELEIALELYCPDHPLLED